MPGDRARTKTGTRHNIISTYQSHPISHHNAKTVLANVVGLKLAVPRRVVIPVPDVAPSEPIKRLDLPLLLARVIVSAVVERRTHVQAVEPVLGVVLRQLGFATRDRAGVELMHRGLLR